MGRAVRPPEIAELRALCTAADLGSVSRAARLLRVTQPALSKRIQSLEAVAGVRLLDRTSQGGELTDEGRRLYEEARKLLPERPLMEDEVVVARPPPPPLAADEETPRGKFLPTPAVMRDPGANTRRVV